VGLGADVVAETGAAAFIGGEQAAQHADGRGLARSVGAEEAVDRAASNLHRQVSHHRAAAEFLGQAVDIDNDVVCGAHRPSSTNLTSTGWPTRSSPGVSVRASIRNTSFERSSWL